PRWSSDGTNLAFYSNRSGKYEIWSMAPDGGKQQQITDAKDASTLYPSWSPDGNRMLYVDLTLKHSVWVIDAKKAWKARTPDVLSHPPGPPNTNFPPPAWSAESRKIAGYSPNALLVYDFDTRTYQRVTEMTTNSAATWLADGRIVYQHSGRLMIVDP